MLGQMPGRRSVMLSRQLAHPCRACPATPGPSVQVALRASLCYRLRRTWTRCSLAGIWRPVRLGGKFLSPTVMLWSAQRYSTCLVVLTLEVIPHKLLATSPTVACLPRRRGSEPADGQECEPDAGTDVSAAWVRLRQQGKGPIQPDDRQTVTNHLPR